MFNQDSFLPQASPGACLSLTIRFVAQHMQGMPPLGIDLEKNRVDRHAIGADSAFSDPNHSVHGMYMNKKEFEARLQKMGFKAIHIIFPMIPLPKETLLNEAMRTLRSHRETIRAEGKGWFLFFVDQSPPDASDAITAALRGSPWDTPSGHAMAFRVAEVTGHLTFVDVNSGWYEFSDMVSAGEFLRYYWELMKYEDYDRFGACCIAALDHK
jgi:hypothetical protein